MRIIRIEVMVGLLVCFGLVFGRGGAAADMTEKAPYTIKSEKFTLVIQENNSFVLKSGQEIILRNDSAGLGYDWQETLMKCIQEDGKVSVDENLKKATFTSTQAGVGRFQRQIILLPEECLITYEWECAPNEERMTFGICTPYEECYMCLYQKPPLNQWHHYVLVSKTGGPTKLYIDGKQVIAFAVSPRGEQFNFYPAYPIRMGISYDRKFKFKGLIGEAKILSYTLSEEEVATENQKDADRYK